MRRTTRILVVLPVVVLALVLLANTASARPMPDGLWTFGDSGGLLDAALGNTLELVGSHEAASGPTLGDDAVVIGPGSYYRCRHGMDANGGGALVNQYTFAFDVKVDGLGAWRSFLQTAPDDADDAEFFISPQGNVGVGDTGYSGTVVPAGQWFRLVIAVNLNTEGGAIDYYLNGVSIQHSEESFWDLVRGAGTIFADTRFGMAPNRSATPYSLLFADNNGDDGAITVTNVALFERALSAAEVSDLGGPDRAFLLPEVTDAIHVSFAEFANLAARKYDTIFITDLANVAGEIRLDNVLMDTPGVPTSIDEGYFVFVGQGITIKNIESSGGGYRMTCDFQVPKILGGLSEEVDFTITSSGVALDGGRFEIPNIDIEETFKLTNAYIEVRPDQGVFGGGGVMKLPTWDAGMGGSIEMKAGLGPEIFGVRSPDVTEFGLTASGLDIPIGEIFVLDTVGGKISNEFGLSNPVNWANTSLCGNFKIVAGPTIEILGRSYNVYAFDATGCISPRDGSFTINGDGKLFNTIETNTVKAHFDPPYHLSLDSTFNAVDIFTGEVAASIADSGFSGMLRGHLGIPNYIPIIGGYTLADATASLHNSAFSGSVDISVTPAIPSFCTPPLCLPPLCISLWYCTDWCHGWWFIYYPCNCGWHTSCWQPPCIPQICTPAIPALVVHFGFSFDAANGAFAFLKEGTYLNEWEVPLHQPALLNDQGDGIVFLTNWYSVASTSTNPIGVGQKAFAHTKDGDALSTFDLDDTPPAILFRCNFSNEGADSVDMTVTTPGGAELNSADGALPAGFEAHLGYSRFNADALEQAIVIIGPEAGTYTVAIDNGDDLGDFTVEMVAQDGPPTGSITEISQGEEGEEDGQYDIAWEDTDFESANEVRIFLDHDRENLDGFLVATLDDQTNAGTYTLDTSSLSMHPGDYFVMLAIDDGVNTPLHLYSDDTITVTPDGTPDPPTNLQFLPSDGAFSISWDPSPSEDVTGYVVLYTASADDLDHFDHRYFVDADSTHLAATVDGLENGTPLLVTVVAVTAEQLRSLPASIVRITPRSPVADTAPTITSTPDTDATAGFAYAYLPTFTDTDFADSYTWSLDLAPDGMDIDPASGLISWTPTAEEEGLNDVILRVTEDTQTALSATQEFELHVYPPDLANGLENHTYQVISTPAMSTTDDGTPDGAKLTAVAGEFYSYKIEVWGPDDDLDFELVAGPEGMEIGTTGEITWDVPEGASGDWIRVRITAAGEHSLEEDYYLHVQKAEHFPEASEDEGEGEAHEGGIAPEGEPAVAEGEGESQEGAPEEGETKGKKESTFLGCGSREHGQGGGYVLVVSVALLLAAALSRGTRRAQRHRTQ